LTTTRAEEDVAGLGLAAALALLAAVLAARALAAGVCHVYDDAFITYRYAVNLARGDGLVYNPGQVWEPVLGTTAPGYAVLLAALVRLGADAVRASLSINVICDLAFAALLLWILRRSALRAALTVAAFAAFPELVRIGLGGMEAPVLGLLALAAAWQSSRERFATSGLLAAIACTVRPEAALLVVVLGVHARRRREALVRFALPVVVVGVLYAGLLYAVYGSAIPHSVVSKAGRHGDAALLETLREILAQAFLLRLAYLPLLPLAAWGAVRTLREPGPLRLFSLFALSIVGAYLAARPHTWGWYYWVPLAAYVTWLGRGAADALEAACALRAPARRALARAAPLAGPLLAGLAVLAVGAVSARMHDRVTERVYEPLAAWTREAGLRASGERVLASDIGAIGYYGMGIVLDSEGLVWPAALRHRGAQMDLVEEYEPEYLFLTAVRDRLRPMREREDVVRAYYPIRRFSVLGSDDLEPRLEDLPERWVQDYLLYRRRR